MKGIRQLLCILFAALTMLTIPNAAYALDAVDCVPAVPIGNNIDTALVTLIDMTEASQSTESLRMDIDNLYQSIIDRGYESLLPDDYVSLRIAVDEESLRSLYSQLQEIEKSIEHREELWQKGEALAETSYTVPATANGMCAAWVNQIYKKAGYPYPSLNACDHYWKYADSSNRDELMPGMIIAVPSHSNTPAGYRWGHVGIIVQENGQWMVRHSSGGRINTDTLEEWITYYGTTYTPQWGFAADVLRR